MAERLIPANRLNRGDIIIGDHLHDIGTIRHRTVETATSNGQTLVAYANGHDYHTFYYDNDDLVAVES